jgi:hypothetical protein
MGHAVVDILPAGLGSRWPLIGSCAAILFSAWLISTLLLPSTLAKIPKVGQGSLSARRKQFNSGAAWDLYLEGYRQVCLLVQPTLRITKQLFRLRKEPTTFASPPQHVCGLARILVRSAN